MTMTKYLPQNTKSSNCHSAYAWKKAGAAYIKTDKPTNIIVTIQLQLVELQFSFVLKIK